MTGTAARIRWHHVDGTVIAWSGYAGTLEAPLFHVLHPVVKTTGAVMDSRRFDEWALCCTLPGESGQARYASDRDEAKAVPELKAEAERWLSGFVASLGAVFPRIPDAGPADARVPRLAVLAVACPRCGVGQQEWCVTRSGLPAEAHRERYLMAKRAGILPAKEAGQ